MSEPTHIPIVEEELSIEQRRKSSGKVMVTTSTHAEQSLAAADLERTDVTVERVPIDREISVAPGVREEGNTTVIPVLEEVLVIEKRLVLKEEIRLTRSTSTEHVEMPVTLRKQTATVERIETPNSDQGEEQ